jgi:hypothetical protein
MGGKMMRYRRTTKKNMVEKKPKPGKGVQTWKRQESAYNMREIFPSGLLVYLKNRA